MIRVMIVDDHSSFRQPLSFMLDREPDFIVVGEAGTLAEARELLEEPVVPDATILDLDLPDGNGMALIEDLYAANPRGVVLVLSGMKSQEQLAAAVEAGASGVLHKTSRISEVIEAVRRLHEGEQLHTPEELSEMLRLVLRRRLESRHARRMLEQLTPREVEILQALADGLDDKEIADRLYVSVGTVRTHMVSIHRKLGVNSRLQALVFAVRNGVVRIE